MQHVVLGAAALELLARRGRERSDEGGQLVLRHRRARTCAYVTDAEPGLDDDERWLLRMLRACQHVDRDTGARQRRRQRAHVDVHPAAVAGTRLCER